MLKAIATLCSGAALLSACASTEPKGNYQQISDNSALVSASGNILVSRMEVEQHAQTLAALATHKAGFTHFIVADKEVLVKAFDGGSKRYDQDMQILMFKEAEAPANAIDARSVIRRAQP